METNDITMSTPVNAENLNSYLADYANAEREFLYKVFSTGFCIPYHGNHVSRFSSNQVSDTNNPVIVQQKIDEEIASGRVLGPLPHPPCEPFFCSPLTLVHKHETGSFWLIHNLYYPSDNSVNSGIDRSDSKVVYDSIDTVIPLVKHSGSNALMAKTDITNAFRLMSIPVADRSLLGFTWPSSILALYNILWIVVYLWDFRPPVSILSTSVTLCSGS